MAKSFPSLALDMSHDGISLHQLAFDGHWHELSRVALNDAALRERLASMRRVAVNLEGRQFKSRIWLPEEQILLCNAEISGKTDAERTGHALQAVAAQHGGKPKDYRVAIGSTGADGLSALAAVRLLTLREARHFAKSHGFTAKGFSTSAQLAGFSEAPVFVLPVEKTRLAGMAIVSATVAATVVAGGYAFYKTDPFNMWELPPVAADFAPFQQPNPGIERAQAPALPTAMAAAAMPPVIAAPALPGAHTALPYLPPRQLTADAQESIEAPAMPGLETTPRKDLHLASAVAVNWPKPVAALPNPSAADSPPSVGFINLVSTITAPPLPEMDTAPHPIAQVASYHSLPRPLTVANTAFFLEPLPAMATRLSPEALAAFVEKSGLSMAQLSQMAQPLLLNESKVVEAIHSLPPILPRLRSGRAIPEQVEPAVVSAVETAPRPAEQTAPTGPAPLFSVVNGQPDIIPPLRPKPPAPFRVVEGTPDIIPATRPNAVTAPAPDETVTTAEPAPAPTDSDAMVAAVQAAIGDVAPADTADGRFALLEGQPDLLPTLRSGATIPALAFASAAPQNQDPATAEANALRPRRRPQAIIDLPAPIDPMVSSAAPISAMRPSHRNASFAANVARITEVSASRPRATSPSVPADPRSVNLPTSASVARAATIENAINLRKTNLLGVYGAEDARTALIRLSNGRLVRVQRGQRFSGWTVTAITTNSVRVQKRNREEILRLPPE